MRTTLTLDEDVAKALQKEMRRSGIRSWKEAVNHFLRLGLTSAPPKEQKPFVVRPIPMGLPAFDCVEELLEFLEGPAHK